MGRPLSLIPSNVLLTNPRDRRHELCQHRRSPKTACHKQQPVRRVLRNSSSAWLPDLNYPRSIARSAYRRIKVSGLGDTLVACPSMAYL